MHHSKDPERKDKNLNKSGYIGVDGQADSHGELLDRRPIQPGGLGHEVEVKVASIRPNGPIEYTAETIPPGRTPRTKPNQVDEIVGDAGKHYR